MTSPRRISSAYVDNDVVSVYCVGSRSGKNWLDLVEMFNLTTSRAIKLVISSVSIEEASRGVGGAVRQRANTLKALHIRVRPEASGNIAKAKDLIREYVTDLNQHRKLVNDARHLLMAERMGVDIIISLNASDFNNLNVWRRVTRPEAVTPGDLARILLAGTRPRIRSNPPRPIRRGSLREFVIKQAHALIVSRRKRRSQLSR